MNEQRIALRPLWVGSAMSVTQEDGGRLNAFAKEPPIQVVAPGGGLSRPTLLLLIGGSLLVLAMLAVAVGIS